MYLPLPAAAWIPLVDGPWTQERHNDASRTLVLPALPRCPPRVSLILCQLCSPFA